MAFYAATMLSMLLELAREDLERPPGFAKRLAGFLEHRTDVAEHASCLDAGADGHAGHRLLAIPSRERLSRVPIWFPIQTGWTALALRLIEKVAKDREA